jgi:hypothetical protein
LFKVDVETEVAEAPLPPLIEVEVEIELVVETSFPPFPDALVLELATEEAAAEPVLT